MTIIHNGPTIGDQYKSAKKDHMQIINQGAEVANFQINDERSPSKSETRPKRQAGSSKIQPKSRAGKEEERKSRQGLPLQRDLKSDSGSRNQNRSGKHQRARLPQSKSYHNKLGLAVQGIDLEPENLGHVVVQNDRLANRMAAKTPQNLYELNTSRQKAANFIYQRSNSHLLDPATERSHRQPLSQVVLPKTHVASKQHQEKLNPVLSLQLINQSSSYNETVPPLPAKDYRRKTYAKQMLSDDLAVSEAKRGQFQAQFF